MPLLLAKSAHELCWLSHARLTAVPKSFYDSQSLVRGSRPWGGFILTKVSPSTANGRLGLPEFVICRSQSHARDPAAAAQVPLTADARMPPRAPEKTCKLLVVCRGRRPSRHPSASSSDRSRAATLAASTARIERTFISRECRRFETEKRAAVKAGS